MNLRPLSRGSASRLLAVVLLLASILFAGTLPAAAADWVVDPANSRLGFRATQSGASFEGQFRHFDAKIAFDPADLTTAKITVTVDIVSVATGAPDRDGELPKPDWFDTSHFPQAVFAVNEVTHETANHYRAKGTLTIRDKTVPLALPFDLAILGDEAHMTGQADIDRTEFGVGQGSWAKSDIVGKTVTILVTLVAKKAP